MVSEAQNTLPALRLVELYTTRPEAACDSYFHDAIGWLRVTTMESDAKLTTLAQVMASVCQSQEMRYRPHMRCTLRATDRNTSKCITPKYLWTTLGMPATATDKPPRCCQSMAHHSPINRLQMGGNYVWRILIVFVLLTLHSMSPPVPVANGA
jgi:hypothetical protein